VSAASASKLILPVIFSPSLPFFFSNGVDDETLELLLSLSLELLLDDDEERTSMSTMVKRDDDQCSCSVM
jgi:hypothetical protein